MPLSRQTIYLSIYLSCTMQCFPCQSVSTGLQYDHISSSIMLSKMVYWIINKAAPKACKTYNPITQTNIRTDRISISVRHLSVSLFPNVNVCMFVGMGWRVGEWMFFTIYILTADREIPIDKRLVFNVYLLVVRHTCYVSRYKHGLWRITLSIVQ